MNLVVMILDLEFTEVVDLPAVSACVSPSPQAEKSRGEKQALSTSHHKEN